jgi:hypothetical protein
MINKEQLATYREWFSKPTEPTAFDSIRNVITGFKAPTNEGEALLQVLQMLKLASVTPSLQVQEINRRIQADPDGVVARFLAKLHVKLPNPLDFLVYIHSPDARVKLKLTDPTIFREETNVKALPLATDEEETVII